MAQLNTILLMLGIGGVANALTLIGVIKRLHVLEDFMKLTKGLNRFEERNK